MLDALHSFSITVNYSELVHVRPREPSSGIDMSGPKEDDFYVRFYVGHKGRFGHEFLEFEFRPSGKLRYANNSRYKQETIIRKEGEVSLLIL